MLTFFNKLNWVDWSITAVVALCAAGVILVQSGVQQTSGERVTGERDIEYTVLLYNVRTLKTDLFEAGKKLSITIRNQPRGEVTILESKATPKKITLAKADGSAVVLPDAAMPDTYEFRIRLKDHALVTDDGYVTNGVKVKTGMKIDIEGFDYRMDGIIVAVNAIQ